MYPGRMIFRKSPKKKQKTRGLSTGRFVSQTKRRIRRKYRERTESFTFLKCIRIRRKYKRVPLRSRFYSVTYVAKSFVGKTSLWFSESKSVRCRSSPNVVFPTRIHNVVLRSENSWKQFVRDLYRRRCFSFPRWRAIVCAPPEGAMKTCQVNLFD